MKKPNKKKQYKLFLDRNAVRIKCSFCSIKDNCKNRIKKEREEILGRSTACIFTPDRPKSFLKAQSDKGLYGR